MSVSKGTTSRQGIETYSDAVSASQCFVQLLQCLSGTGVIADLHKLYADLGKREVSGVESSSSSNNNRLWIIS